MMVVFLLNLERVGTFSLDVVDGTAGLRRDEEAMLTVEGRLVLRGFVVGAAKFFVLSDIFQKLLRFFKRKQNKLTDTCLIDCTN